MCMSFSELREIHYLRKVLDESLWLVNISPMVFREAVDDVEFNGMRLNLSPKLENEALHDIRLGHMFAKLQILTLDYSYSRFYDSKGLEDTSMAEKCAP